MTFNRYLFFSRPKGAMCWTQSCNDGEYACFGFTNLDAAQKFMAQQMRDFPGNDYYIAEVALPV